MKFHHDPLLLLVVLLLPVVVVILEWTRIPVAARAAVLVVFMAFACIALVRALTARG